MTAPSQSQPSIPDPTYADTSTARNPEFQAVNTISSLEMETSNKAVEASRMSILPFASLYHTIPLLPHG